jgi:hypothetical protein
LIASLALSLTTGSSDTNNIEIGIATLKTKELKKIEP